MNKYDREKVYSTRVANKLIEKGYKLMYLEPNPKDKRYHRYVFKWEEGIKAAIIEASK